MRFPNSRDRNEEQEAVYLYAPSDGRVLVTGPPGTGKTVIALLRALEVAKSGRTPVVVMFNRVLETYASSRLPSTARAHWARIRFCTMNRLIGELWTSFALPPAPGAKDVLLCTPFAEKDEAKAAGARWRPEVYYGKKRGCWVVEGDLYRRDPSVFARWAPRSALPTRDDNEKEIDWDALFEAVALEYESIDWSAVDFDALIIDEGQDFPPGLYRFLHYLSEGRFGNSRKPALMVLADENQRLIKGRNSTVAEIRKALRIEDERHYRLSTNFRNSKPIALVARHFYAGMTTGMPALPERGGSVPELRRCSDVSTVRSRLLRYADNNPKHEIGVIVLDKDNLREKYFKEIEKHAPEDLPVQTYSSVRPEHRKAAELKFDRPGVTVINRASCKGLEFDAVFVVSLDEARIGDDQTDFFKMGMYVMTTRARTSLFLIWIGVPGDRPAALAAMPLAPLVRECG